MSFVLDALKISERRRSKFARPLYVHPPRPVRARTRRRWIGALGSAAAIALVFVAWRLLVATPSASSYQTDDAGQQSAESGLSGAAEDRTVARVSPTPDQARSATGEIRSAPSGGSELPQEILPPSAGHAPWGTANNASMNTGDETEPAEPLLPAPPADWPSLELQMLFYSPEIGRSFAQINGQSYHVGDRLEDGPQVRAITSDGVILAHRGKRIRLGMQR